MEPRVVELSLVWLMCTWKCIEDAHVGDGLFLPLSQEGEERPGDLVDAGHVGVEGVVQVFPV